MAWFNRKIKLKHLAKRLGIPILAAAVMFGGAACARSPPKDISVTPEQLYEQMYKNQLKKTNIEAQAALQAQMGVRAITGQDQLPQEQMMTKEFIKDIQSDGHRIAQELQKQHHNPDDDSQIIGSVDAEYQ